MTKIGKKIDTKAASSIVNMLEDLEELLDDTIYSETAIGIALKYVLDTIGRPAGAVVINEKNLGQLVIIAEHNLSDTWKNSLYDSGSARHSFVNNSLEKGENVEHNLELDIAAIIPLTSENSRRYVLLIEGEPCSHDQINWLSLVGEKLSDVVYNRQTQIRKYKKYADYAPPKSQITRENDTRNIGDVYGDILENIEMVLNTDSVSLILNARGDTDLVFMATKRKDSSHIYQTNQKLGSSFIAKSLQENVTLLIDNPMEYSMYYPALDGSKNIGESEINPLSILITPVKSQGKLMGVLIVRSNLENFFSEKDEQKIESLANLVSSVISTANVVSQLSISNANLVANRWELLRSRDVLRTLFDNIPLTIYIIDKRYELIAVNNELANKYDLKASQLVGKTCYQILKDRTSPCPECRIRETFLSGESLERTSRQWTKSRRPIEHTINTYPIRNEMGEVMQGILIEEDVTERRVMETRLAQSEKLASVGQLVAGLAHEINNPMSAIIANAQILQLDLPDDEDSQEAIDLIIQAGERANRVLNNLLDISRQDQYEFNPTDINQSIVKTLALLQYEITSRSMEIKLNLGENLAPIMVSQDHLQGVWINLLINAMDSISHKKGKIEISSYRKEGNVIIGFSDNGSGIPQEKIPHIFDPFYTTKGPKEGTGLGLSVCHETIKRHGGFIDVESQVGLGTSFIVTLPITN